MKSSNVLAAALTSFASTTLACIRVHVDLTTSLAAPDTVTIQVFNNNVEICNKAANKEFFTDNESWYVIECPVADFVYKVGVTENGKKGSLDFIQPNDVVDKFDLELQESDFSSWCCALSDSGCKGNCGSWESSHFAVGPENSCHDEGWEPIMCDHRTFCEL